MVYFCFYENKISWGSIQEKLNKKWSRINIGETSFHHDSWWPGRGGPSTSQGCPRQAKSSSMLFSPLCLYGDHDGHRGGLDNDDDEKLPKKM